MKKNTGSQKETMQFEKTVIFSDFHGDLDTLAKSFADKGLMQYSGDDALNALISAIEFELAEGSTSQLEGFIIPQRGAVRLLFLGDCLDRYDYGYHIIRFLNRTPWEKFDIFPVWLMGNHDLLNVMIMSNPFQFYNINQGVGHSIEDIVEYTGNMGLDKSLDSFFALHGDELFALQQYLRQILIVFG